MTDYFDHKGKKLKKGFYRRIHSERIYYFTGEYDEKGFPQIEGDGKILNNSNKIESIVKKLNRIEMCEMERSINRLKKRVNWLEDSLMSDKIDTLREDYEKMKKKNSSQ